MGLGKEGRWRERCVVSRSAAPHAPNTACGSGGGSNTLLPVYHVHVSTTSAAQTPPITTQTQYSSSLLNLSWRCRSSGRRVGGVRGEKVEVRHHLESLAGVHTFSDGRRRSEAETVLE